MVQQAATARGINHIWHFTRVENLPSILSSGIQPRAAMAAGSCLTNDYYRLDGQLGASCFSIGHPNYKMFYRLRCESPGSKWIVLACRASILWEKDCAFCHENAASNNVTSIAIGQRKSIPAFNGMFAEAGGKPPRQQLQLTDDLPTNPQAEVLVFGTVESTYIVGAVFDDSRLAGEHKTRYPAFQMVYHRGLFLPRKDYEHWR